MKNILLLIYLLVSGSLLGQEIYIHCGQLIDTREAKVLNDRTIVVAGDIIQRVVAGHLEPPSGVKLIDLSNSTVMPGLIDMHVHIESDVDEKYYFQEFRVNDAELAYNAALMAHRTLQAGFTTVRDLGGNGVNVALRNAVANGIVPGPRIYTCEKAIASTGGHADPTNGWKRTLDYDPGPADGVINSVEDAAKAVRQRYKNGADVIKITATGGVLSVAKNGLNPQLTVEEIRAIVATAKDYGMHVAAHAHGDEGMKRAILGGVTTIEHGTFMSEETMDLMIEHDVYLVPTISAGKYVAEKAKVKGFLPDIIVPKALSIGIKAQTAFKRAYDHGVKIAFGTDAGIFPNGENGKEFGYMVEAGMPALDVIQSATIVSARILGEEDNFGTIEAGKKADIIAVQDDPRENIHTMEDVIFVMKEGKVYKNKK